MPRSKNKKRSKNVSTTFEEMPSSKEKLETLIEEAEAAVDTFNYDEAESKLKEVLQIHPNNTKCLEMLSGVCIEKFEWTKAQDLLKRCIEIEPELGHSKYFSMGQLCEGLESVNYYEKGIQVVQKELENKENHQTEPTKELNKHTLQRNLSDAYCSIAEIFMTDCCFEENAEEKCHTAIDLAIKSDPSNPEGFQCLANFQLVKGEMEEAKKSVEKSLSLWMPEFEKLRDTEADPNKENKNSIPEYDSRIKTSKLLIELKMFNEASAILEGLLEDDDEVVEVWYLLGWLNYIRDEDEYKENAHIYLRKAKQISVKLGVEDECVEHIDELLEELSKTHPLSDDEEDGGEENEEGGDSDFSTDSEEEENRMES